MTVPLDTVNDIRSMDATGRSRSEIARMLHVSRNTVAKYADMEDMSPAAPMPQRRGGPALEGNEEWVAGVVEADLGLATLMRTVPGGALETGGLDREAALIGKARLLVIDELGFLPLDADGARLLFQVFADAYERQSVVITTNPEFSRLGRCSGTTR